MQQCYCFFSSTLSFPSAQNKNVSDVGILMTTNMTADDDSDGENATELNGSGNISSLRGRYAAAIMIENMTADDE
jgi:hypothetical protein